MGSAGEIKQLNEKKCAGAMRFSIFKMHFCCACALFVCSSTLAIHDFLEVSAYIAIVEAQPWNTRASAKSGTGASRATQPQGSQPSSQAWRNADRLASGRAYPIDARRKSLNPRALFREVGRKFDRWLDLVFVQRFLDV